MFRLSLTVCLVQCWLLLWWLLRALALAGASVTSTKSLQCTEWTVPSARQKPNSQPLAALKSVPGMGDIRYLPPENQDLQLQKWSGHLRRPIVRRLLCLLQRCKLKWLSNNLTSANLDGLLSRPGFCSAHTKQRLYMDKNGQTSTWFYQTCTHLKAKFESKIVVPFASHISGKRRFHCSTCLKQVQMARSWAFIHGFANRMGRWPVV